MKLFSLNVFLEKKESWIISIIIIGFSGLDLPFLVIRGLRIFSYIMICLLAFKKRRQILHLVYKDKVILALHLLAFISVTWTVAPYITSTRFIALIRTTLAGVILATYTPNQQRKLLINITLICGLLSILAITFLPTYGINQSNSSWEGIFLFKNYLSLMMIIGVTYWLSSLLFSSSNKIQNFILIVVGIILIIFSESGTFIASLAASTSLIPLYVIVKQNYKVRPVYFAFTILLSVMIALVVMHNISFLVQDFLGKDLTLTGRDTLWKAIISQGLKRPLSGYGFAAFWYSDASLEAIAENGWPDLPPLGEYLEFHSHSGFVEIFVQLGFPGLVLMVISFTMALLNSFRYLNLVGSIEGLWMLQLVVIMIIANYTEVPSFVSANNFQWILYVSITLSMSNQLEIIRIIRTKNSSLNTSTLKSKSANPYLLRDISTQR